MNAPDAANGSDAAKGEAGRLTEDVEDLRITVDSLAAQLQETTEKLDVLRDVGVTAGGSTPDGSSEGGSGTGSSGKEKKGQGDGKHPAPPLILRLPGPEFDAELALLGQWVQHLLVPHYLDEITSHAPWCPRWFEHPQAVARLHALWTAWQELTTPAAGGWTGPSVWHRDHLDPCIAQLRSPSGPFAGCMTNPEREQHHIPPALPVWPAPGPPAPAGDEEPAST